MLSMKEWIKKMSEEYAVQDVDDLNGIVVDRINENHYLVRTVDVKEK